MLEVVRPPETPELLSYLELGRDAGCSAEQLNRFAQAQVFLQERQMRASAAARSCDAEGGPIEIGYGGARGGGKSFWALAQVAADDCQRCPGLKVLFLRKVGKSNMEQLDDLRRKVLRNLKHVFVSHRGVLHFPNGSRIIAGHFQHESDIDAYLGLEYDVIAVEEATTLAERKYRDIKTCLRSSKPGWRPRMYLTTNPGGIGHAWFKRRFIDSWVRAGRANEEERGETRFIQALVDDNRWLNAEYRGTLERLTGWQKAAWRHGNWDLPLGQYFPNFREEMHVRREIDDTLIREWRAAMDYGFTHYTCVYLGGLDGDGNFYVVDCHRARQWLPQRHAAAIKEMIGRHVMRTPNGTRRLELGDLKRFVAGADVFSKQSDGTTVAQQYRQLGIRLTTAHMDRIQGWADIQQRLGCAPQGQDLGIPARLFIHERCAALIECLQVLQHDPHRPEDVLKVDCDEDGNGGDDDADAFRYLVASKGRQVYVRRLIGY
mgnify:CR=1 FL=1